MENVRRVGTFSSLSCLFREGRNLTVKTGVPVAVACPHGQVLDDVVIILENGYWNPFLLGLCRFKREAHMSNHRIHHFLKSIAGLFNALSWIAFRPKHYFFNRFNLGKDDRHLFGEEDVEGVSYCKICFKTKKEVSQ